MENRNNANSNYMNFAKKKMQIIFNHKSINVIYNKLLIYESEQLEINELAAIIYFENTQGPLKRNLQRISKRLGGITKLEVFFSPNYIEDKYHCSLNRKSYWLRERVRFNDITYRINEVIENN